MNDDVWTKQAAQWERVGPPLRPSASDHALIQGFIDRAPSPPRVLVLGVTPEMARHEWPEGTDLIAADRSEEMIANVWPGYPATGQGALHADWRALPLPDASRDLVVSDGCFGVLPHPEPQHAMLREVRRVLAPNGRFGFRVFARPDPNETPADVFDAALDGRIQGFHAFKLRLLMAAQPSTPEGIVVGDVWRIWSEQGPGASALHARCGWPPAQIATIDAYRDNPTVYCFPTESEVRAMLAAHGFSVLSVQHGDYELGERCPTYLCRA